MIVLAFLTVALAASTVAHSGRSRHHKRVLEARSSIPSGWTDKGCFVDSISHRALGSYHTSSDSNTPTTCINECSSEGYNYAGVEYGKECWCANSISKSGSVGSSASGCTMKCSGNGGLECGGGNRIEIYERTSGSSTPTLPGGKVCLAWGGDGPQLKNFKTDSVGMMYNWGPSCPSEAADIGLTCAPQLWGWKDVGSWHDSVPNNGCPILGMNEPNEKEQSDMSAEQGYQMWKEYIEPYKSKGHILISPATSSAPSGYEWMEEFFKLCGPDKCGVDFVAFHWYDLGFDKFKAYAEKFHDGFGLPLLVTEYAAQNFNGGAQATYGEVWDFLEQSTAWMDETDWIVKYCWFGALPNMQGVNQDDSLWDNGGPNALGKKFIKAS